MNTDYYVVVVKLTANLNQQVQNVTHYTFRSPRAAAKCAIKLDSMCRFVLKVDATIEIQQRRKGSCGCTVFKTVDQWYWMKTWENKDGTVSRS